MHKEEPLEMQQPLVGMYDTLQALVLLVPILLHVLRIPLVETITILPLEQVG